MKNSIFYIPLTRFVALALILVMVSACAQEVSQPAKPVANINSPENGSSFSVGQEVMIAFGAADVKGVAQVELSVDNQAIRVETVEPPVNSFVASHVWTPEVSGSHIVEVRAFNVDGDPSEPAQIVVVVHGGGAEASPTPTTLPVEPEPTPTLIPATNTPITLLPTPTLTSEPVEAKPMVAAVVNLNIRAGPGLDYAVIGRLAEGESAEIVGRDEFAAWWQIVYPSAEGGRAWVAASAEFSTASNTEGVSIAEAPPPSTAPPTPTSESTTDLLRPTIYSFTANRYTIAAGESVVLSWDLDNAKEAYLRYNGVEEGVVAPGTRTVSPDKDTVYTLVARNDAGETTAELTIKVGGPTPTPIPVLRDGKTRLVNGQSIDFDQGVVQDNVGSGADFYWDGQQKRFLPQGTSTGALIGSAYEEISLTDCLSVSYGQPITGIDGSSRITGCYKTSEGRYGKFYVSEWDLVGNLTVIWLTWDYR